MSKHLDQILVIDIEATCWERNPPQGQSGEIIPAWLGHCSGRVLSIA